jgi:PadR family transcriptional regulator PadR
LPKKDENFEEKVEYDALYSKAQTTKAMRRFRNSLTKGNLFIYILRLLQEKERYGYELKEAVKEQYDFEMAGVTPYTVLYRMTLEGLIILESEKESPLKKPARKYYKITPLGNALVESVKHFLNTTYEALFGNQLGNEGKTDDIQT